MCFIAYRFTRDGLPNGGLLPMVCGVTRAGLSWETEYVRCSCLLRNFSSFVLCACEQVHEGAQACVKVCIFPCCSPPDSSRQGPLLEWSSPTIYTGYLAGP